MQPPGHAGISRGGGTVNAAPTLADAWDAYMQDQIPIAAPAHEVAIARRRFYAGALAAVEITLRGDHSTTSDLQTELVAYGRTIGTALELAR